MKSFILHLTLTTAWLYLLRHCQKNSYHDHSSIFYDPARAYSQEYSAIREFEADRFLERASLTPATAEKPWIYRGKNMDQTNTGKLDGYRICVGIPSVRREREQFVARTIASLIDALSPEERRMVNLKVLLADEIPHNNPAYGQAWLHNSVDEALVYGGDATLPAGEYTHITSDSRRWAPRDSRNKRVQYDYANLISACRVSGADYFVLAEDDVIASRDWFQRLHASIESVESQTTGQDWLYLRLFYTETYLGWNSEESLVYLRNSLLVYMIVVALVLLVRLRSVPYKPMRVSDLIRTNIGVIAQTTFWIAAYICLFFMAGRLMVSPIQVGVYEMSEYGCCAQGLAIPHRHLETLEHSLVEPPHQLAGDQHINMFADMHGLKKWAMTPSVLQHVGIRCSSDKGGYYKTTWNFSFERGQVLEATG